MFAAIHLVDTQTILQIAAIVAVVWLVVPYVRLAFGSFEQRREVKDSPEATDPATKSSVLYLDKYMAIKELGFRPVGVIHETVTAMGDSTMNVFFSDRHPCVAMIAERLTLAEFMTLFPDGNCVLTADALIESPPEGETAQCALKLATPNPAKTLEAHTAAAAQYLRPDNEPIPPRSLDDVLRMLRAFYNMPATVQLIRGAGVRGLVTSAITLSIAAAISTFGLGAGPWIGVLSGVAVKKWLL